MPTKDEPIITFRASWEMKSRIADEVLRLGLRSKGEFIRLLLEEALSSGERSTGGSPRSAQPPSVAASPRAAVEQASGESRRGSGGSSPKSPTIGTDAPPAPAESSEEPYVPQWRKSLMTTGERSNWGPRPKKS
jgi:hypothetical protein